MSSGPGGFFAGGHFLFYGCHEAGVHVFVDGEVYVIASTGAHEYVDATPEPSTWLPAPGGRGVRFLRRRFPEERSAFASIGTDTDSE